MVTIEEAVVARMGAYNELSALIGTRLYPMVIPQDAAQPAIAYQVISGVPERSHTGFSTLTTTRFQFTCQAETYSAAKALSKAVRHCWDGFRGSIGSRWIGGAFVENELDLGPEAGVRRVDVRIQHDED